MRTCNNVDKFPNLLLNCMLHILHVMFLRFSQMNNYLQDMPNAQVKNIVSHWSFKFFSFMWRKWIDLRIFRLLILTFYNYF